MNTAATTIDPAPPGPSIATPRPAASVASRPAAPAPVGATSSTPTSPAVQPAPAADSATVWRRFFEQWPEGLLKRGIVVNRLDEQMPFKSYMVRGEVVLLERTNPDTLGARFLIVPYAEISLVKLIDPLKQELLEAAGFRGKLAL